MKKKVMVVDDTPDTLEVTQQILQLRGFEAITFDSSVKALQALKEGISPDLVLLDMRMPGLSGIDFCKEVRADKSIAKTRIVFFTASSDLDKALQKKWGVLGFIFKPFDIDKLVKDIEGFIKKKP